MNLLDLPDELLTICCAQIAQCPEEWEDEEDHRQTYAQFASSQFQNLRLTCKRLSPIATKQLFSRLNLLPTKASAQKARTVLEDERMNPLVHTISLRASLCRDRYDERQDLPSPSWHCLDEDDPEWETDEDNEEHAIDVDGEVSCAFKRLLDSIGLFKNLRRIELVYDHQVSGVSGDTTFWQESGYYEEAPESIEYRGTFFGKILSALNHPDHPVSKFDSLSITNLQDWVDADLATSENFKAMLSRLDRLELYMVSEKYDSAPEFEINFYARHEFYGAQLRKYWLEPLSAIGRLTSLKLFGSVHWGYLPKCDLRGLHFPKLRRLILGHMDFTHDWQLEWILSHASSLESLALLNCPIVIRGELDNKVDDEGYPVLPKIRTGTQRGRRVVSSWDYAARWHDYFRKFGSTLHRLRHFAITHGSWPACDGGPDHASRVFAANEKWPAQLRISRYCKMSG